MHERTCVQKKMDSFLTTQSHLENCLWGHFSGERVYGKNASWPKRSGLPGVWGHGQLIKQELALMSWHSRKGKSCCRCAPWGVMKQILLQQVWFFPEAQGCKDLTLPGASASHPPEAVLGHWWARAKATVGSGMGGGGGGQGPPFRAPVLRCQASQKPQWLRVHLPMQGTQETRVQFFIDQISRCRKATCPVFLISASPAPRHWGSN